MKLTSFEEVKENEAGFKKLYRYYTTHTSCSSYTKEVYYVLKETETGYWFTCHYGLTQLRSWTMLEDDRSFSEIKEFLKRRGAAIRWTSKVSKSRWAYESNKDAKYNFLRRLIRRRGF